MSGYQPLLGSKSPCPRAQASARAIATYSSPGVMAQHRTVLISEAYREHKTTDGAHSGDRAIGANYTLGIRHVAFAVDDADAAVAGVRALGGELVGQVEPHEDMSSALQSAELLSKLDDDPVGDSA